MRTIGPYVVAALVLVALLRRYRLDDIVAAMRAGHALSVLPVALGFSVIQIFVVSAWDTIILRSILPQLRYFDVLRVKAGCAVLQAIAYLANQGAYGTWIARAVGVGVRNAAALVVLTWASDFVGGTLLITACIYLGHADVPFFVRVAAPLGAVTTSFVILALPRRPLDPHEESGVIRVWQSIPRARVGVQMVGRVFNAGMLGGATWVAARAFGLTIPFSIMIVYVPIVFAIGGLPLSVGGFGAVQGAWLLFLPWASGPQLLAFQFIWSVALMLSQIARGAPFVRRVIAEVAAAKLEAR